MSNDIPRLSKFGPADRVADPLGEHATAMELVAQTWTCDNDPDQRLGGLRPARQAMVAISRVLFEREGEGVLLLEEPTPSLPEAEVRLLLDALRRHAGRGQTIVFVTHRLEGYLEPGRLIVDGEFLKDEAFDAVKDEISAALYFAGEHTADSWATSVDGALRSSLRAAGEILRHRNASIASPSHV